MKRLSLILVAVMLCFIAIPLVLEFLWGSRVAASQQWENQVVDLKAGKTTRIIWPEPRFLEGFVRDQPDVAAKVTEVDFLTGKVSDERFGYVKQFPRLETIYLFEIWEGANAFLGRMAGMESVTDLCLSRTLLSAEGMQAAASFPNLKRLKIDYVSKNTILEPLRGHKRLETLVLKTVPITKEQIAVIASLPNLRKLEIEQDDPIPDADLSLLQKSLPNVRIERTDNGP